MLVKINGAASEVPEGLSIDELIVARKMPAGMLIVELNGEIIRKEQWKTTSVHPGDTMELVRIIGGG